MPEFSIQISADVVAWYGAILATAGTLLSLYTTWSDRVRLHIDYQKGMKIINAFPPLSENKEYFVITIRNQGKRPASIGNVAVRYFTGECAILGDSIHNTRKENRVLTEENPYTTVITEQSDIDLKKICTIHVFDHAGRKYNKHTTLIPTFKSAYHKFLLLLQRAKS